MNLIIYAFYCRATVAKMFTLNEDESSIVLPFNEEDSDDNGVDINAEIELCEGGLVAEMENNDCGIPRLGQSKSMDLFSTDECEEFWD